LSVGKSLPIGPKIRVRLARSYRKRGLLVPLTPIWPTRQGDQPETGKPKGKPPAAAISGCAAVNERWGSKASRMDIGTARSCDGPSGRRPPGQASTPRLRRGLPSMLGLFGLLVATAGCCGMGSSVGCGEVTPGPCPVIGLGGIGRCSAAGTAGPCVHPFPGKQPYTRAGTFCLLPVPTRPVFSPRSLGPGDMDVLLSDQRPSEPPLPEGGTVD